MQFISGGPDIPDELLQAHEDGRVVFFCGAGISIPAKLPDFENLVDSIYKKLDMTFTYEEEAAYTKQQYDTVLEYLERRLSGSKTDRRMQMRNALMDSLNRKRFPKNSTSTHEALLTLSKNKDGYVHLVTTNYDHLFQRAAKQMKLSLNSYTAPLLPVPKVSRWDGLVYLHGVLPNKKTNEIALNNLVVTSGDFGLAYLVERWAARFISYLFHNYIVCFIGYSINDIVLRYIMDALAAESRQGETIPKAWLLMPCKPGEESQKIIESNIKNVKSILYRVPKSTHDHSLLHKTLQIWAEIYRDGIHGKEAIIRQYALAQPQESTAEDNFIGRMLWALSDSSGLPAKFFAEYQPTPSLDWLFKFDSQEMQLSFNALEKFDLLPAQKFEKDIQFSIINRPSPSYCAPRIQLVGMGTQDSHWDEIMQQLGRWLLWHLHDPRLLIWISRQGGQLHETFRRMIIGTLDQLSVHENNVENEIDKRIIFLRNSVQFNILKPIWRMTVGGRIRSTHTSVTLSHWIYRFQKEGLTSDLRIELRSLLAPKLVLKKPFRMFYDDEKKNKTVTIKDLIDWEIVLSADHVRSTLNSIPKSKWNQTLQEIVLDLQLLLNDALIMMRELGEADAYSDRSVWDLPSISDHKQNRGFHDWVCLIELLRDSWLSVYKASSKRAREIASYWNTLPYLTFKRLALFAASQPNCIHVETWLGWLLSDEARPLWSLETRREVCRLFVLQGSQLSIQLQAQLENVILQGPPHSLYPKDYDFNSEHWKERCSRMIVFRLLKLMEGGLELGEKAVQYLRNFYGNNSFPIIPEEREFLFWFDDIKTYTPEEVTSDNPIPKNPDNLATWLRSLSNDSAFHNDVWQNHCQKHMLHCIGALQKFSDEDLKNGKWKWWSTALYTWSQGVYLKYSWRCASTSIANMSDEVFQKLVPSVVWWIECLSEKIYLVNKVVFIDFCSRIIQVSFKKENEIITCNGEPETVNDAINHPIGQVTQALLNYWFNQTPKDDELLPDDIKTLFSQLCDRQYNSFRAGRVMLASNVIALFRVDPTWTKENVLPLFVWDNLIEAKAAWEGFLWSPRIYPPFLKEIKNSFLACADHYDELGKHKLRFAAFLTYVALNSGNVFTFNELQKMFAKLPPEGLEEAAQALYQSVESADSKSALYWKNVVRPFWRDVWEMITPIENKNIAEKLALMAIAAKDAFPDVLERISAWLCPIDYPFYLVEQLKESGLCSRFPRYALKFLSILVTNTALNKEDLNKCLNSIIMTDKSLIDDNNYKFISRLVN